MIEVAFLITFLAERFNLTLVRVLDLEVVGFLIGLLVVVKMAWIEA